MIEVEDLQFTYAGSERPTLAGLTFSVGDGEVLGLLGPSGAGKSTTQKILTGLLRGFSGRAAVRGIDMSRWRRKDNRLLGVGFELPNLYSKLTALENLSFFASLYPPPTADPLELLQKVDLADAAHVRVARFSKGMKMRLNFCRALINHPQILLLDEPTGGMDPARARLVTDEIARLRGEGKSIFLTTHDMALAARTCDRVAFLVDGRIKRIDTPEALMRENSKRRVEASYREAGQVVSETFDLDGLGSNDRFLQLLRSKRIEAIHTLEATLEDVFIRVSGSR